jgi:hypothetical protein
MVSETVGVGVDGLVIVVDGYVNRAGGGGGIGRTVAGSSGATVVVVFQNSHSSLVVVVAPLVVGVVEPEPKPRVVGTVAVIV